MGNLLEEENIQLLKYEVSPSQWLKKTANTFICIFRVAYMNSKQTWLLAKVYCQFEAKFRTLMIEETLSAAKFRFEAKIQRKSALCSNEMSLKRPRTFDRIFARTFDERSLEQITKFAEFRLHYFCTILYSVKENYFCDFPKVTQSCQNTLA